MLMPKSITLQFREQKMRFRAMTSLRAKGRFSKRIQDFLLKTIFFIKEIDKKLYP